MADNETILAALAAMDHADDAQWLDDGLPKTGVVQRLADDQSISRRDIEVAAPDFRRQPAEVSGESPDTEQPPPVEHNNVQVEPPAEPSITDGNQPPPVEYSDVLTVADAQKRVVESRVRLRLAHERQREARGRVARAVAGWQQAIGAVLTPEQNARQFITTSLAERATGGGRPSRSQPGPSIVDRMAFGHGRSVNQGRYGAWKRGAMSIAESTRRLNEAARAKVLPSER